MNIKDIQTLTTSTILGELAQEITLFNHTDLGVNDLVIPHKHDFYMIFFVEQGTGIHDVDFVRYTVENYQLFFLRPQQVHNWQLANDTKGYQLMFSGTVLQSFLTLYSSLSYFQMGAPCQFILGKEEFVYLFQKLEKLQTQLNKTGVVEKEIANLSFCLLLKELQLMYLHHHPELEFKPLDSTIEAFEALLEVHFKDNSQVSYYADKLNITPNYLNILCKRFIGSNASKLIQDRQILEAKRLLITSNASVKEIAYTLSYTDSSYFSNFFKKQVGQTPGAFRKSYKNYNY